MDKELLLRQFFKSSLFNSALTIASKGINLVALPFYWSVLSIEDLAVTGTSVAIFTFLLPFFMLGLNEGVMRLYSDCNADDHSDLIGSMIIFYALGVGGWLVFSEFIVSAFMGELKNAELVGYFDLCVIIAVISAGYQLSLSVLKITGRDYIFSLIFFAQSIMQVGLSLLFIMSFSMGVEGLLEGYLYSYLVSLFLALGLLRGTKVSFGLRTSRELANYSFPLVPAGLIDSGMAVVERFIINGLLPLSSLGVYNVSHQIASSLTAVNQGIKPLWSPFIYRLLRYSPSGEVSLRSTYSFGFACAVYTLFITIFAIFVSNHVWLIAGFFESEVETVKMLGPIVVVGLYALTLASIHGKGLDMAKRTNIYWIISASHFFVLISLFYLLIPKFGVLGAGVGFSIACVFRSFVQIFIANIVYSRLTYWVTLSCCVSLLVVQVGFQNITSFEDVARSLMLTSVSSCMLVFVFCVENRFVKRCVMGVPEEA